MAKKQTSDLRTYPVAASLRFDGEKYKAGDTVDMGEEDAAPLRKLGVLGPAKEPDKKPGAAASGAQ